MLVLFGNRNNANTTFTMPIVTGDNAPDITLTPTFRPRTRTSPTPNRRRPAVVRGANVPLRRGPGSHYHLNRRVTRGTQVTIIHLGRNNWRYVQLSNGTRGWMQSSQLTAFTTNGVISNPNVRVLGRQGNWSRVLVGNQVGWIQNARLRANNPTSRVAWHGVDLYRVPYGRRVTGVSRGTRVSVLSEVGFRGTYRQNGWRGMSNGRWNRSWSRVRLPNGRTGWVLASSFD